MNRYRIMELSNGIGDEETSVWIHLNTYTTWTFAPQSFHATGFVHVEPDTNPKRCPVPFLTKIDTKKLDVLRDALADIYEGKRKTLL